MNMDMNQTKMAVYLDLGKIFISLSFLSALYVFTVAVFLIYIGQNM